MRRYERASTIVTSNRPVEDWGGEVCQATTRGGENRSGGRQLDLSQGRSCRGESAETRRQVSVKTIEFFYRLLHEGTLISGLLLRGRLAYGSRAHFRPIVRLGGSPWNQTWRTHGNQTGRYQPQYEAFSVKLRSKGQDVKVEVRPIHVLIRKSKNGKPRTIPLSNVAKDIFTDLLGDEAGCDYVFANPDTARPYTNVGKAFGAACREAEIQDLTFHDLRHTFASRLREAGVDAITRSLLGHSTVEMSDDYTHS